VSVQQILVVIYLFATWMYAAYSIGKHMKKNPGDLSNAEQYFAIIMYPLAAPIYIICTPFKWAYKKGLNK
jgi:hypothetical protein